jgi:hypothetical protein
MFNSLVRDKSDYTAQFFDKTNGYFGSNWCLKSWAERVTKLFF